MSAKGTKLTPKQERFVAEYLIDLNATKAAMRAGYSEKTAEQLGHQLLKKTSVQQCLQRALSRQQQRTEITADLVLKGLLTEAQDRGEGSSQAARVSAWTQLGKHLRLFTEQLDVTSGGKPVGVKEVIVRTREEASRMLALLSGENGASVPAVASGVNGEAHRNGHVEHPPEHPPLPGPA